MTIPNHFRRLFWGLLTMFSLMASSQAQLTYNDGDVFLSVRAVGDPGSRSSYEINLGPVTQFTTAASGEISVNLSLAQGHSITEDLVELFGADWATRSDVFWSVTGVKTVATADFLKNTFFMSAPETTVGEQSIPHERGSAFQALQPAQKAHSMGTPGYSAGTTTAQTQSIASTKGLKQTSQATNSYASFMPGGANTTGATAFSLFANPVEANFGLGAESAVVDLYVVQPGTGPGVLVGGFRLSSSGVLTFNQDITGFQGPAQVKFDSSTFSISEDGGSVAIKINRVGNKNTAFTLNFSTTNGTAIADTDYIGQTNTVVSFAVGDESKTVNVTVKNRDGFQPSREFSATLAVATGAPQLIDPSTATITIGDTSLPPTEVALSAPTYSALENVASGNIVVTVTRSGSTDAATSVTLHAADGTALNGTDYTIAADTVVNFGIGQSSKNVEIPIANRDNFQGDRSFTVTLVGPTGGATLGTPNAATVTIQETSTNPAGQVAFSAANYSFGAADAITVVLNRTAGTTGAVSVDVALDAGGTLDGADLVFTSPTTVDFADGIATQSLTISLANGASPLPGTFNLKLVNPTGGLALGTQSTTTVAVAAAGVPDLILPKLKLTSPKAGKTGATFSVTGVVTDADTIARVEVRLNGGPVMPATVTQAAGTASFALNGVAAENGKNTLLVQAFDVKGTGSKVTKVSLTYTNVRLELAGAYNGLVTPTAVTPPGNDLNNASGLLTVTVSKTGTFTGKVKIGGATLSFGGIVANDGTALFKPLFGDSFPLQIKGRAPALGDLKLNVVVNKITGVIGTVATIDADRAFYDGKVNLVDADYLTANKGKFTVVLPAKDQATLTADKFPQGTGFATVTVTKQGKFSLVGTLADGTAFSASVPLSQALHAPIFAQLYSKKGSFAGVVELDKTQAGSDMSAEDCLWLRPLQDKAKQYVAGWPGGVKIDLFGAAYKVPAKAEGKSVFPGLTAVNDATGNASLVMEDGKLTNAVTKDLNIAPTNKVTTVPATDKSYKVSISSATGKVTGSFTHSDGTKPALKGIVYQKGPDQGAWGFFLSTVPKGGPAGEAGGFTIRAKIPPQ